MFICSHMVRHFSFKNVILTMATNPLMHTYLWCKRFSKNTPTDVESLSCMVCVLILLDTLVNCFLKCLYQFTFTPSVEDFSYFGYGWYYALTSFGSHTFLPHSYNVLKYLQAQPHLLFLNRSCPFVISLRDSSLLCRPPTRWDLYLLLVWLYFVT